MLERNTSWPLHLVHLTDLHLGRSLDIDQWSSVKAAIKDRRPAALLVTGDLVNHGGPTMLAIARRELMELASEAESELIVIPGNHDVSISGIVPAFSRAFEYIFIHRDGPSFRQIPTFDEFRQMSWWRRVVTSAVVLSGYAKYRLTHIGESPLPLQNHGRNGNFSVGLLDSNHHQWLASGHVSNSDLDALDRHVEKLGADPERALLPRPALVHHHLVVPPRAREGFKGHEGTLLLRNAGTVLDRLARNRFDVVLHGHRHRANFLRVITEPVGGADPDRAPERDAEILILGGGSAALRASKRHDGKNSLAILKLHHCGRIDFCQIHYSDGQGISLDERTLPYRQAATLESVKRKHFARAVQLQGLECDLLERTVRVDEGGTGSLEIVFDGLRNWHGESVTHRRFPVSITSGIAEEMSVRLHQISLERRHRLEIDREGKEEGVLDAVVHFDKPLNVGSDHLESYGVEVRATNGFYITHWEAALRNQQGQDSFGTVIRYPTRKLVINLSLPQSLVNASPRIECDGGVLFPRLTLNADTREVSYPHDKAAWTEDQVMTRHEKRRLTQTSDGWCAEIDTPIVGWKYKIVWDVQSLDEGTDNERDGDETIRIRHVLAVAASQEGDVEDPLVTLARSLLKDIVLDSTISAYFGPAGKEFFSVLLYTFDAKNKRLRLVAGVGQTEGEGVNELELNWGISGNAFKKRKISTYVRDDLLGGNAKKNVIRPVVKSDDAQRELAVVVAIPAFRPGAKPRREHGVNSPEDTIGVMAIGCRSPRTALLDLRHNTNEAAFQAAMLQSACDKVIGELIDKGRISGAA